MNGNNKSLNSFGKSQVYICVLCICVCVGITVGELLAEEKLHEVTVKI